MAVDTAKNTARRMPVRTVTIAFDWEGVPWSATLRKDAPAGVMDNFFANDTAKMREALKSLVLDWDMVDEEGQPIPLPRDGGIAKIPYALLRETISHYIDALLEDSAPPKASETPTTPG